MGTRVRDYPREQERAQHKRKSTVGGEVMHVLRSFGPQMGGLNHSEIGTALDEKYRPETIKQACQHLREEGQIEIAQPRTKPVRWKVAVHD